MNNIGKVKMMSSRNNNFSNRGQKLKIIVRNITTEELQQPEELYNNIKNDNLIVGMVVMSILLTLVFSLIIYKRREIREKYSEIRKNIKRSTATHV